MMTATKVKQDVLARPVAELAEALGARFPGRERNWAQGVADALGGVQQALLLHTATTEGSDGLFSEVDLTRPTLVRNVGALRLEHGRLLEHARSLQAELQAALVAFKPDAEVPTATTLPEMPTNQLIPHFGSIRDSVADFLNTLRRHQDHEADLILESVNTDIGVGD